MLSRTYTVSCLWLVETTPFGDDVSFRLGAVQRHFVLQKPEITMEVGGWMGPGLTRNLFGKIIPKQL